MELIKSEKLGCEIVLCTPREKIEAQKTYPGKVIYFYDELDELRGLTTEELLCIHNVKNVFGGHLKVEGRKKLTLKDMRGKNVD